jgi:hypothetical protein
VYAYQRTAHRYSDINGSAEIFMFPTQKTLPETRLLVWCFRRLLSRQNQSLFPPDAALLHKQRASPVVAPPFVSSTINIALSAKEDYLQKLRKGNRLQIAKAGSGMLGGEPAPLLVVRVVVIVQVPSPLFTARVEILVEVEPFPDTEPDPEDEAVHVPLTAGTISTVVVVSAIAAPANKAATRTAAEAALRLIDCIGIPFVYLGMEG